MEGCAERVHSHDYHVLGLVEDGRGTHLAAGQSRAVGPRTLVAIAAGERHGWTRGSACGWSVNFLPRALDPALLGGSGVPPVVGDARWAALRRAEAAPASWSLTEEACARWSEQARALSDELASQRAGYAAAARSLLSLLLVGAARAAPPAELEELAEPDDPIVADVLDVIDSRYSEQLSLTQIAVVVSRTPGHISRVVKEATGETVMHLLEQRRMAEARRLLLSTDLKIDAVAERVGLPDASHFRRRFRRAHGEPPQAWRQLNR